MSVNGVPSLCYDGVPVSPASVYLYRIDADEVRRFAATGIHLYTFGMRLSDDETFATFDRMVDDLAAADPQACFFPRVYVDPPDQWLAEHGDEATTDEMGVRYIVSFASPTASCRTNWPILCPSISTPCRSIPLTASRCVTGS